MLSHKLIQQAMAKTGLLPSLQGIEETAFVPLDQMSTCQKIITRGQNTLPFFGTAVLKDKTLDDVATLYAMWALGTGPYARKRQLLLITGIDPNLRIEGLYPGEYTLANPEGRLRVREIWTRRIEGGWLLRVRAWVTVDEPGISLFVACHRSDMVRLSELPGGGVRLEHAIQLTVDPKETRRPFPGPPSVLMDLSPWSGEEPLNPSPDDLVDEILAADRSHPILLLIPGPVPDQEGFFLPGEDPELLYDGLDGVALVREMDEDTNPTPFEAIKAAMASKGIPEHLLPPEGGARLYMPGFAPTDSGGDHRTWSATFFERNDSPHGERMIASETAALTADFLIPRNFMNLVSVLDAQRLEARQAEAVAAPSGAEAEATPAEEGPDLTASKDLLARIEAFAEENDLVTAEMRHLEGRLAAETARADDLEFRLRAIAKKQEGKALEDQATVPGEAMEAALGGSPSLEQALLFLQYLFPSRVVVLPSAMESAREAEAFRFRSQAFRLLKILVTDYWRAMMEEGGDAKARLVFGTKAFSAQESETVATNAVARAQRTVFYKGRKLVLEPHLRIGSGDGEGETLRIHFEWDREDCRVVIGHCGRHLDHR